MKRKRITVNFIWFLAFLSVCLFLMPSITNTYANMVQISRISGSANAANSMTDEDIAKEKEKALAYNRKIAEEQMVSPYAYQGQDVTDAEYESILNMDGNNNGTMAYIEIPSIDVYLPIAHGTSDAVLAYEAGHMYGSSLPIGGPSSNAMIAAHTGLPTARLFSDIKDLKTGDEIFITVLNEIHCYEVTDLHTVPMGPDEQQYMQIDGTKDTITLYTCSPYGVNSERVLVRAERNPDKDKMVSGEAQERTLKNKDAAAERKLILMLCIPVLIIILWIASNTYNKKKHNKSNA